jgi:aminoglycoside phosphotransferase (APT) family kinase protein
VPYADYVESTIEGLMESAAAHSASTTEADIVWARGLMAAAREAMEVPFAPAVVHLDYGFHNVLLDGDRLTAVIDWMTAESGHPEADLARPLAIDFQYKVGGREQFLAGYRTVQPELHGFRERFPVFMLWERSLIWEYWQRHKGFKEGLLFRDWVEPFVRMLDD